MELILPITEVIKSRSSWRTYTSRPVDLEALQRLEAGFASLPPGPFGNAVRLQIIHSDIARKTGGRLGTYGVIRGATTFVAGVVRPGVGSMEDFGYVFESAVLLATSLGLGTCWLGGAFSRFGFRTAMQAAPDELLPAVTPIGYPELQRSLVDSALRLLAGSQQRKNWDQIFFQGEGTVPLTVDQAGPYAEALEMVRLAPSASNKQPWIIRQTGQSYHFFLNRTPGYRSIAGIDIQTVDLGIALCHFALTAGESGQRGEWVRAAEQAPAVAGQEYLATWIGQG